jgi:peroxiredoxin
MKYLFICLFLFSSIIYSNNLVGEVAPRFSLDNSDGSTYYLSDYIGYQIVLVEFFGSWCDHCQDSVPVLNKIQNDYRGKVKVLSINYKESVDKVKKFIDDYGAEYTILRDATGSVSKKYNLTSVPKNIFIDLNGKVVKTAASMSEQQYIENIEAILGNSGNNDNGNTQIEQNLLLITGGKDDTIAESYRTALNDSKIKFDEWDITEKGYVSYEDLVPYIKYGAVIRYFPVKGALSEFSEKEMKSIHDYLQRKGSLFIAGPDFATKHSKSYFFKGVTLSSYNGRFKISDDTQLEREMGGVISEFVYASIDTDAADADSMGDVLSPIETSMPMLYYPDGSLAAVSGST